MDSPAVILAKGTKVRTNKELEELTGLFVPREVRDERRPDTEGVIEGIADASGDVYWVTHEDGARAPYVYTEFELVPV
jgi:hypothetical protein